MVRFYAYHSRKPRSICCGALWRLLFLPSADLAEQGDQNDHARAGRQGDQDKALPFRRVKAAVDAPCHGEAVIRAAVGVRAVSCGIRTVSAVSVGENIRHPGLLALGARLAVSSTSYCPVLSE